MLFIDIIKIIKGMIFIVIKIIAEQAQLLQFKIISFSIETPEQTPLSAEKLNHVTVWYNKSIINASFIKFLRENSNLFAGFMEIRKPGEKFANVNVRFQIVSHPDSGLLRYSEKPGISTLCLINQIFNNSFVKFCERLVISDAGHPPDLCKATANNDLLKPVLLPGTGQKKLP